jgi:hypothetical protein
MAEFDWQFGNYFKLLPFFISNDLICCFDLKEHLVELIPIMISIFFAEFFIDWIKHAFILRFNDLSADLFKEFKTTLSYDLINTKRVVVIYLKSSN